MTEKLRNYFSVLVAMTFLCVQAFAQSPPERATDEPQTGSISGKVVNENGQPMAGASAMVREVNSLVGGRTTTTDADGNFRMNNLGRGLYIVSASAPAYTSSADLFAQQITYYRLGDSVNLQLTRGGVITGSVTNAAGEPVIAVRVRATLIRDAKGQKPSMPSFAPEQSTDDRGIYRLYGLAPGSYLVSAGGSPSFQTYLLNPYDDDVPTYAPSATRDNAAEVSVRGGEETTVDIRYRGDSGYTISGTVKVGPNSSANVSLLPAGGVIMPMGTVFQAPGGRGFAFHGLSDGEYDLVAQEFVQDRAAFIPVMLVSEQKRVVIKGANVSGIELIPRPLSSIKGQIVLETSKAPECEGKRQPLFAETLVQLRRPDKDAEKEKENSSPYMRIFGGSGSPDSSGAFVLRNMSPGRYQFEPRFYARYWYLQSVTLGSAPATTPQKSQVSRVDAAATWTVVKPGDQLTNLTITLAAGAASVRGKLTSTESPQGMVLHLVPAEQDKATDVLRFFVTEIAADGTFALNNLPPGRYWLVTQTNADAQTATLIKLRQPEAAPARIKLRKTAETQKTEIELKPCQNLTDYQLKQ